MSTPTKFRILRINRESVPSVPACSIHTSLPLSESKQVLLIHKDDDKPNAQYFCTMCQRDLTERLLRDYFNFPNLRQEMGVLTLPVSLVEALINTQPSND